MSSTTMGTGNDTGTFKDNVGDMVTRGVVDAASTWIRLFMETLWWLKSTEALTPRRLSRLGLVGVLWHQQEFYG